MNPTPVRSLKKALDLLSILGFEDLQDQGMPLKDLAARMKMPVNSAHNLLKTMAHCGYIAQNAGGKYRIGPAFLRIAHLRTLASEAVHQRLDPLLRSLSNRLGEGAVFVSLVRGRWTRLAHMPSPQSVSVDRTMADHYNIYSMATGRVLTAFAPAEELAVILSHYAWPGAEWNGISNHHSLQRALEPIRRNGYALIVNRRDGLVAMACPATDANGQLLGALGVHAPLFRCRHARQMVIIKEIKKAAHTLGATLSAAGMELPALLKPQ